MGKKFVTASSNAIFSRYWLLVGGCWLLDVEMMSAHLRSRCRNVCHFVLSNSFVLGDIFRQRGR